jgi:predicted regulator of Ras-like GTPase activity (Roadblock/LC7/MglB family)
VDVSAALAELTKLSAEIERAVVFDASGEPLGSTDGDDARARRLAEAASRALAAAAELHSADEVTRVEVELAGGGLFVLRDGGRAIAATTKPGATAGLVVYDLRTCLQQIDEPKPKRPRAKPKPKDADGKAESA